MSQELGDDFEVKVLNVDPKQTKVRIDKFITDRISNFSRSKIQKSLESGDITVNDEIVKSNYKVSPLDVIKIRTPKVMEKNEYLIPEEIPLNIVYEDEHMMIVNKQAGLVVHPGHGNWTGTLVNGLIYHLQKQDLPILPGNSLDRPGIVHRLDKDTSGLIVIAKTELAMQSLYHQFFNREVERTYKAIVWGEPEESEGTIDVFIGRDFKNRIKMATFPDEDFGKNAITHYRVLKGLYYVSLLECNLETGRTHQIRIHLASIGHPIFNDELYGGDRILKGTVFSKYSQFVKNTFDQIPRQALHAAYLKLRHPETDEVMEFRAELPEDFQKTLDRWERYLSTRKNHE